MMMNRKGNVLVYFVLVLVSLFNVAIQNFDFLTFKNSTCSFYVWIESCMLFKSFLLNKLVRFSLILALLLYECRQFYALQMKASLYVVALFLALLALAFAALLSANFIGLRLYFVLHPMLFSPVLPLLLLVYQLLQNRVATKPD